MQICDDDVNCKRSAGTLLARHFKQLGSSIRRHLGRNEDAAAINVYVILNLTLACKCISVSEQ